MSGTLILAHYERVGGAPDAVSRLRRFVLDLAVRGKLVPQNQNDEPSVELLKRIAKQDVEQSNLPTGWHRTKVGTLFDFKYGKGLSAKDRAAKGPVPVFGSNGIVGFTSKPLTTRPSVIVGRKGSAGALNLCDGPSWTTDVAYFVEPPPFIDLRFLLHALAALDLEHLGKGVKPGLSRSDVYDQLISIPPLPEQRRIVAKLNELVSLCDQLEASRAKCEATRDSFTTVTLARLNAPDPETFRDDASFTLDAVSALTARADQIKPLRQCILNLAVHGKLVPQDLNDEPASELLKRIARERAERAKAAKVRIKQPVSRAVPSAVSLPSGWEIQALGNLVDPTATISYGVLVPGPDVQDGVPFVRAQELRLTGHPPRPNKTISKEVEAPYARTRLRGGEILLCVVGSIGKVGIAPASWAGANIARAVVRIAPVDKISTRYLLVAMQSEHVQNYFAEATRTLAQPTLNVSLIEVLPVPVPPLAEQCRIVAKVDELMALCDRLEASLVTADNTRSRLLEALLAEALAPVEERELEAAE